MKAASAPSKEKASIPLVGIGASAGGLEAVSRLLSRLPADTGMAFVVVQHLDPTRESLLPMILQKSTKMIVSQAKNGILISPNEVYVIPPNAFMVVSGRRLRLIPRPTGVLSMSVNCFLYSLAEERGNKAVAIILSGTASDGALGIRAIKSEGGIVFAQDEGSAGHFGMPQSAAATGVVDFILTPEKIAEELTSIAKRLILGLGIDDLFHDSASLDRIIQLLKRSTGVDFSLYKPSTIRRRLMRRLMLHKLKNIEQYKKLLEKNVDEIHTLHDDLLIHVTHFFREPKAMAALRAKAFPKIVKALPPDATIRVWVPGCSSGEEAYTIAIVLLDFLSERKDSHPIQIFATDISDIALEQARAGIYSREARHYVPPRLLRRFFTKVDRGYEIAKSVRDTCVFAKHDLTKDPPFANLDLISCCNVLIYLDRPIQKKVLPMFHYALRPHGALLFSSSETVGEFSGIFAPAEKKCRLYYKKHVSVKLALPLGVPRVALPAVKAADKTTTPAATGWPENDVQKIAERILLSRFAPAGVIVSGALEVLHFRGRVSRYLEPNTGKANLSLLKMLPAHSADKLNLMIKRAKKSDTPVREVSFETGDDDGRRAGKSTIEVIPFRLPISGECYFIILFEEPPPRGASAKASGALLSKQAAAAGSSEGAALKRIKNELASTRGYLQTLVEEHEAANEELKAANEEIISSNEELQSTNEELEIAKEELQATNEELNTVNEELQTRNSDLGQLNSDLLNLISSVHLPIVMVSSDLRIRRFSAMAEKVMNLIPGDIGRPMGDIKPKMALPNIEQIIHEVIETAVSKELEIRGAEGHSFAVRIQPYKTIDNKIDGAVIVFIDNDPISRSIHEIKDVSAFEAVLDIVGESLAVLDDQLRVKSGSRSLYQTFGLTPSSFGRSFFEIDEGRWNVPALRGALERLAARGEGFSKVPFKVSDQRLYFSARRIMREGAGPPLILLRIAQQA